MSFILDDPARLDIIQRVLNYFSGSSEISTPPTDLQTLAECLKALAEPKRLLILNMLMEGVQCNCELGEALSMQPNLISHHLHMLRRVGLVNVQHDARDARWAYYSIHHEALDELAEAFRVFFDPGRIKPRRPSSGPRSIFVRMDKIAIQK